MPLFPYIEQTYTFSFQSSVDCIIICTQVRMALLSQSNDSNAKLFWKTSHTFWNISLPVICVFVVPVKKTNNKINHHRQPFNSISCQRPSSSLRITFQGG